MRAAIPWWIFALLLGTVGCASPGLRTSAPAPRNEWALFGPRRAAGRTATAAAATIAPPSGSDGRLSQFFPGLYASSNPSAARGVPTNANAIGSPRSSYAAESLASRAEGLRRGTGDRLYASTNRLGSKSVERTASSATSKSLGRIPPRPKSNALLPYSIPVASGVARRSRSLDDDETALDLGRRLYARGEELGQNDSEPDPEPEPVPDPFADEEEPPVVKGELDDARLSDEAIDDLPKMSRKAPASKDFRLTSDEAPAPREEPAEPVASDDSTEEKLEKPSELGLRFEPPRAARAPRRDEESDDLAGRPRLSSLGGLPGLPPPLFPATYHVSRSNSAGQVRTASADADSRGAGSLWRKLMWNKRLSPREIRLARREPDDVSQR